MTSTPSFTSIGPGTGTAGLNTTDMAALTEAWQAACDADAAHLLDTAAAAPVEAEARPTTDWSRALLWIVAAVIAVAVAKNWGAIAGSDQVYQASVFLDEARTGATDAYHGVCRLISIAKGEELVF